MQDIMSLEENVAVSKFGQSSFSEYDYVHSLKQAMEEAKGSPNAGTYRVLLCETQPLLIEGVKSLLRNCSDLKLVGAVNSLATAAELVRQSKPHVVILDKGFGLPAVADWIGYALAQADPPAIVVWGGTVTEAEAVRFVHTGVTGVVRKDSDPEVFLECVRSASRRRTWLESSLAEAAETQRRPGRSNLTPREQQVVELVEQGMKNKEIAQEMGIRPGTVKIHLKHIFEKTGVRGRFGLALAGLRNKGLLNYSQT
jgi:DNA-binding NarL/FixJ family response regulator